MDPRRMNIRFVKVDGDVQHGPVANGGRGCFSWARQGATPQRTDDSWTSVSKHALQMGIPPMNIRINKLSSNFPSQEAEKSSVSTNCFSVLSGANARGRGSSATRSSKPPPVDPKSGSRLLQGRNNIKFRASREHDRELAIAAAQRALLCPLYFAAGDSPSVAHVPAAKEFTDGEIDRKATYLVDEYLHNNDLIEALLCVRDIKDPSKHHKIIYAILNHVLELSQQARTHSAKLMSELLSQEIVSDASFIHGWVDILEFADDLATDIPKLWTYFGELIAPIYLSSALPLVTLRDICKPCMSFSKAHVLAASVLKAMVETQGIEKVADAWWLAQLQWSEFAPATCNLFDFLERSKLEMLNSSELTISQIKAELLRVVQPKVSNDAICKWIQDNLKEEQLKSSRFVPALMTAVCSSVITEQESKQLVNVGALKDRTFLLHIYLHHDGNLELQALYALEALMVHISMRYSSGLLQTFFEVLYEEDLISKDSFFKWNFFDDSTDDCMQLMMRDSTSQFLLRISE